MELDIWNGNWGLPSIEFKCLQALTLLKISGATYNVNKLDSPFRMGNGLPVLRHCSRQVHSFHQIFTHLKQKNYHVDMKLSSKEEAESFAYRNMVEQKLFPALRYIWWVDEKNFVNVTRPLYAKIILFPFNFFYPGRYRRENESAIQSLYPNLDDSDVQLEIFKEAEKCLVSLSIRLDKSDFFFGNHPSSLDAYVYGCLAPLLKAPFPSNTLQNHLKACPNLVKFITRLSQRYFSQELIDYEKKRPAAEKNESKSDVFPNKVRNQILAVMFAVTAMLFYGFSTGIFSLSLNNAESDDVVGYEDDEELSD